MKKEKQEKKEIKLFCISKDALRPPSLKQLKKHIITVVYLYFQNTYHA